MSEIEDKYFQLGGPESVTGRPTNDEQPCGDGLGRYRLFQNGAIFWHPSTGAHETHGGIHIRWTTLEWERGRMGYPVSDERPVTDEEFDKLASLALDPNEDEKEKLIHLHWMNRHHARIYSRCSDFQGGRIYWLSVSPEFSFIKVVYGETGKYVKTEPWKGIAGMRELKAMLERDVINPLKDPQKYRDYGLGLPNGILLYGPPGCGKTLIARALAQILGFAFIEVSPGMLGSPYVHGTQLEIKKLFADALKQKPCMLFFDEMDAMVPHRRGSAQSYQDNEVTEFLVEMNECAKRRLLIVGATNRKDNIDPAVLRPGRLDKKFFVGLPDDEARADLLQMCMANRKQKKMDWGACSRHLKGYTCAEIEHLVNEAARFALQKERPIGTQDILDCAANTPPSHADAIP